MSFQFVETNIGTRGMLNFVEKYGDMKRQYKRRHKNDERSVQLVLEFLTGSVIRYDKVIFLCENDDDSDLLRKKGFVQEKNLSFEHSLRSMYWEKYNIEIEVVAASDWKMLKKCVELAELTGYFNINKIHSVLEGKVSKK